VFIVQALHNTSWQQCNGGCQPELTRKEDMQRRKFIRLVGGGAIAAAALPMSACSVSSNFPTQAVEAWLGPQNESDPRRRATYNLG
jgi:hypothetical protein